MISSETNGFEAPEKTAWWFRLWTGNDQADGHQFRFFGTTGAGDYAGFWLARPGAPITAQPVVYLGSEGETAVIGCRRSAAEIVTAARQEFPDFPALIDAMCR